MWKDSIRNIVVIFQTTILRIFGFYVRRSALVLKHPWRWNVHEPVHLQGKNMHFSKCPSDLMSMLKCILPKCQVPKRWEAVYIPVADGTTATSQSQDEHGLTFEEFPPTETPSDFWPPFLVISSEINWPSLTGSMLGGINLTVTAVTGEPWSCKRKNIFCNSTLHILSNIWHLCWPWVSSNIEVQIYYWICKCGVIPLSLLDRMIFFQNIQIFFGGEYLHKLVYFDILPSSLSLIKVIPWRLYSVYTVSVIHSESRKTEQVTMKANCIHT